MSEIADASIEDSRTASQLLSEARTALGLSQEEVAQELYLIPSYIRHIDNDEIEKIDKQAFVRGYLRSYAKLVHLDGDDMVARYEKTQGAVPQTIEIRGVTQEPVGSINFTGPVIQTGVLGLVGLIVVIAIVWFLVSSGDDDSEAPIVVTEVSEPAMDAPEVQTAVQTEAQTEVQPEVQTGEVATNDSIDAEVIGQEENQAMSVDETSVELSDNEPATLPPVQDSTQTQEAQAEPEPAQSSAQNPLIAASEATPDLEAAEAEVVTGKTISIDRTEGVIWVEAGGSDELRFNFSDECWVEIEDADGDAIYGDLNRSGDELVVRGVAPFEVLFGKAPAVTMVFNGDAIDLTPHTTSVETAKVRVP